MDVYHHMGVGWVETCCGDCDQKDKGCPIVCRYSGDFIPVLDACPKGVWKRGNGGVIERNK